VIAGSAQLGKLTVCSRNKLVS